MVLLLHFVANFFLCTIYLFYYLQKKKNGQKQVKKKALKINADVGLNEDNKKWSLNFHDKLKSQNPTYCFFFLKSELSVSSWSIPAFTTIKENNSSYLLIT